MKKILDSETGFIAVGLVILFVLDVVLTPFVGSPKGFYMAAGITAIGYMIYLVLIMNPISDTLRKKK